MDGLSTVMKENAEMCDFLMNPVVSDEKKKDVLDKLAKEADFAESTTKFLKLIVDKGRVECIEEICDAFEDKYCELTDTQVIWGGYGGMWHGREDWERAAGMMMMMMMCE